MTKKEKNEIRGQISMLKIVLANARCRKEEAVQKGDWEKVFYWNGRIEAQVESIDFLNEITNWEFYK